MPVFRARCQDGSELIVDADRVLSSSLHTIFQVRRNGVWAVVLELRNDTVVALERRIAEMDDRWSWTAELPTRRLGLY